MTVDWDAATVLTLTEFEVAWEAAGLDETPWELDPPRHGRTWEERREIVDGALASLAARGLVDDRRPVPRLAAALAVLDRRELSVDVRVHGTTVVGAVAARHRGRAVLAVRHEGEIALADLAPTRLSRAAVEVVGPVSAARGRTVNVRAADVEAAVGAAGENPGALVDELVRRGVREGDAATYVAMHRDVDRHGMVGVCVGRRRAPWLIGVHRTASGHVVRVRRPAGDGRDVLTVAPVDAAGLARRIDDLIAAA
ncbi:MAG: ESX secretion-associated protein EspG [Pseudonocardia sp.]|uniref:ESX secretion-associated protein EspG n=1 Tax=unclassified Pseudonocardia TaxID=2619320 RepID=UPI000869E813|nr:MULTISPECIES: ESX secretion-associated protein EspG [unclassified Pseudonocardia]MBN9113338.1 ESX secretion-associated protein EspG [Pseudonocardia sp.]ODU23703.1 MAG: hypothetical protein ABS80_14125 [Pseudonocardia sp. SCN 72-51]ODV02004.1 MAG: hypothetical protein ABT15_26530 [Pseudonocardia sp. SCN 73-27]